MANVQRYELADGRRRYRVRWLTPDRKKHSKTFERKRDADRFADERRRRKALGGLYEAAPETLASFLEKWLSRYAQRVRPSTLERRREALPHLAPFMPLILDKIFPSEVEDHITAVGQRAPRQAQIALQTLKIVLANAKERGHVVNEGVFSIKPPRTEQRERQFLSWGKVEELALNTIEPYGNLIRLAALTGLRQGELFALTDDCIDWEDGTIGVKRGTYRGQLVPLKTKASRRTVDLSGEAKRVLRRQLMARKPNEPGLVFPSPEGKVWHRPPFLDRIFRPASRRTGLMEFAFHDLRHTYATLMIRAGAHPKYLQSQMGHTSVKTTIDLYGHLIPDANRLVLTSLDQLVQSGRDHPVTITTEPSDGDAAEGASEQAFSSTPSGIRTRDLRLERPVS
jgi:integrase